MTRIILTSLLLVGLVFADENDTCTKSVEANIDSLRKVDSALIAEKRQEIEASLNEQHTKDSILFANKIPDSLRAKVLAQYQEFLAHKAAIDSIAPADSAKFASLKAKVDSLRKRWEAKRDTQISKIKDTAVQTKVKARLAEIAVRQSQIRARIEMRKAKLEATIAALKAKIATAKLTTP